MKILQNIVLSVALAASTMAFSGSVMANEKGVSVQSILDATQSHVNAAIAAIDAKEKDSIVLAHIKEARQAQKDIIVGALDQKRQKASSKLVAAGRSIQDGKPQDARVSLEEAKVAFNELSELSKSK